MQGTTTMQFKQGTRVYTSDGQDIGKIDRVVMNPRTKQVTHVVLRKDALIPEDKVIPIEHVVTATNRQITLRETADGIDKLPPFEEDHYIPSGVEYSRDYISGYAYPVYPYPPLGSTAWNAVPGTTYMETERNIPINTEALREGSKVVSNDDKHVGN